MKRNDKQPPPESVIQLLSHCSWITISLSVAMAKTIWCLCITLCVLMNSSTEAEKINLNGLYKALYNVLNFALHHNLTDKNLLFGVAIVKGKCYYFFKNTFIDL